MQKWLALAAGAGLVLLGVPPLFAEENASLRIDKPEDEKNPITSSGHPLLYDPFADLRHAGNDQDQILRNPFYEPDPVKAALSYLPRDLALGPMDIPDYAEQDRLEKRADYAIKLGRNPRHHEILFGMPCDLTSPLGFTCKLPDTDCIVQIGFPPAFLCSF